ncbi:MAG: S-methyl-5-thioribose-1-phosphate isomerase [Patescibacteria group bacterium]
MSLESIIWRGDRLSLLDQTRLPGEAVYLDCRDFRQVASAIRSLSVRGAPAIGVAGAFGLALAAGEAEAKGLPVEAYVREAAAVLRATRPTAVNLAWALDRALKKLGESPDSSAAAGILAREARAIMDEDRRANQAIGRHGQELLQDGDAVLTHCNAGALATTGHGTALGVIRAAVAAGKRVSVYADETRPLLQGARLTALELMAEGIPVTLICDNMAAALMARGKVSAVLVGADRIAKNGDAANKIGTYGAAVLASAHGIPFYVAAPMSTYDPHTASGAGIPIEERDPDEVRRVGGTLVAPPDVPVWNPAFDVTPVRLIDAVITEYGVARGDIPARLREWHGSRPPCG